MVIVEDILGVTLFVSIIIGLMMWRRSGVDRMRTRDEPVWKGRFACCMTMALSVAPETAVQLAARALSLSGCENVGTLDPWTVTGWYFRPLRPGSDRQLSATIRTDQSNRVLVLCACRPRYSRELTDWGVCLKLTKALVQHISEMDPGAAVIRSAGLVSSQ